MPRQGRPPPPPKPEELIEMLEKKFEAYKVEMSEALEEKTKEMLKMQESQEEVKNNFDAQLQELGQSLQIIKSETASNINETQGNQEALVNNSKEELHSLITEKIEALKTDLGSFDCTYLNMYLHSFCRGENNQD